MSTISPDLTPFPEDFNPRTRAFLVASMLTAYPDPDIVEILPRLLDDDATWAECENANPVAWTQLAEQLELTLATPAETDRLRSTYIEIFDRGRESNPPYETEYGRERAIMKASQLADIAAFYCAFGFKLLGTNGKAEMHDHASVELEFYALLRAKSSRLKSLHSEGLEIVDEARAKFIEQHLGTFLPVVARRPGVEKSPFYRAAYDWAASLVKNEAKDLGVHPKETNWITGQEAPEATCCAIGDTSRKS